MPLIRDAVRGWTQHQVRLGMAVPGPAELEALAGAVYDQRYGLGSLAAFLRDPQVENVDINGFDRVWVTYSTGEKSDSAMDHSVCIPVNTKLGAPSDVALWPAKLE